MVYMCVCVCVYTLLQNVYLCARTHKQCNTSDVWKQQCDACSPSGACRRQLQFDLDQGFTSLGG